MNKTIEVPKGAVDASARRCAHIPVLRSSYSEPPSLDPAVFARTACYQAGHLVAKNAGWRNIRPQINLESCTGCLQCYLYCPDGALYVPIEDSSNAKVAVDLDFCKGCGICAKMCRFGSISMVPENEVGER